MRVCDRCDSKVEAKASVVLNSYSLIEDELRDNIEHFEHEFCKPCHDILINALNQFMKGTKR